MKMLELSLCFLPFDRAVFCLADNVIFPPSNQAENIRKPWIGLLSELRRARQNNIQHQGKAMKNLFKPVLIASHPGASFLISASSWPNNLKIPKNG
jgi:hypothetical protein